MNAEAELTLATVSDQCQVVLLPVFAAAVREDWREIAHAVFVEVLEMVSWIPAADEMRGGAEAREKALTPFVEQLTSMMRIVTSSICEDCGECQEKELWWRMTETARTLAEQKPGLADIVKQLEQVDIRPTSCCQRDC